MAFYSASHMHQPNTEVFHSPTDKCFYCGEPLMGSVWIYWQGASEKEQQIWMHPACARVLGDHLLSDFYKHFHDNGTQRNTGP